MVEKDKRNPADTLVVTELPYQVNKARLIEKIAELVRDKAIEGIKYVRERIRREGCASRSGSRKRAWLR